MSQKYVSSQVLLSIENNYFNNFVIKVRSLGQQRCTAYDLHTLAESLTDIRKFIQPSNTAAFQDYVEVHMKQIHNMMLNSGAV